MECSTIRCTLSAKSLEILVCDLFAFHEKLNISMKKSRKEVFDHFLKYKNRALNLCLNFDMIIFRKDIYIYIYKNFLLCNAKQSQMFPNFWPEV